MQRTATVNYHVHKPHRQAFELDAGGIVGNLVAPELAPTEVQLRDVRDDRSATCFDQDGVQFLECATTVTSFESEGWQGIYDAEIEALLKREIGVREVIVFDHTVRTDDPDATRKPARNVHSDYSTEGAKQRVVDLLGQDEADEWAGSRYAFINVWRPVDNPINSAPLGFVRPSSVARSDWVLLDLIYPDRKGQIMGLVGNDQHEWFYLSRMHPEEIVIFSIFDSAGQPSVAHSALDMVEDPSVKTIRKSIETRTLVRF